MPAQAVVFDAYGTLFDVAAAARAAAAEPEFARLQPAWPALAEVWRRKQLEYTWLRSLMGAHADFDTVTADALDWALDQQGLAGDSALRGRLLALYDALAPFPEAAAVLDALRGQGARLAILSNGSPRMLDAAVRAAGFDGLFEAVLSVEEVGRYKPDPAVYGLVEARMAVPPGGVLFVSSNGWDIAGAARFGFTTAWVNRALAPVDRLTHRPAVILPDLTALPELFRGAPDDPIFHRL
jgi:2-haloacid dehalogenase